MGGMSTSNRRDLVRAYRADSHDISTRTKILAGTSELKGIVLELGLSPAIADEAVELMLRWKMEKRTRHLPRLDISRAAIVIVMLRTHRLFIPAPTIYRVCQVNSRYEVLRAVHEIRRDLHVNAPPLTPCDMIASVARRLEIPVKVCRQAKRFAKVVGDQYVGQGVAAASLYMAVARHQLTNFRINQETIAKEFGTTPVTLRCHQKIVLRKQAEVRELRHRRSRGSWVTRKVSKHVRVTKFEKPKRRHSAAPSHRRER
jgi:transcription initiation factor TFIIIB Brf1 subunit/transcription initiation factor TFIIB